MAKDTRALGLTIRRWPHLVEMSIVGKGGEGVDGAVEIEPPRSYRGPIQNPKLYSPHDQFDGCISNRDEAYRILRGMLKTAGYPARTAREITSSMEAAVKAADLEQSWSRHPSRGLRAPLASAH